MTLATGGLKKDCPLATAVIAFVRVHAQDEHSRAGQATDDLARHLDAVQQRHADVQHDDVRVVIDSFLDRRSSVACFCDDRPLWLILEQLPQSLPHQDMIIGEQ
jgi:hypothetical protein